MTFAVGEDIDSLRARVTTLENESKAAELELKSALEHDRQALERLKRYIDYIQQLHGTCGKYVNGRNSAWVPLRNTIKERERWKELSNEPWDGATDKMPSPHNITSGNLK